MSQFRYPVAANHKLKWHAVTNLLVRNTSELSLIIFEGGENEKGGADILKSTKHSLRYMYNLDIQSLQKAAPTNKYTIIILPFHVPRSARLLGQRVIMSGTFTDSNRLFNRVIFKQK